MVSETLVEKEGSCDEAPCVVREDLSILGWVRICLVGLAIFGTSCSMSLQGVFSIPFAMKMGLPESSSSLVWLCGPVTGMIIQPLVGRWSDGHVSRGNGRSRLPFLVVGALILSLCTVVIGYSIELGELLGDRGSSHTAGLVVLILIFWVYDAASNVVMVVSRSALVDNAPPRHVPTGFFTQTFISELGGMCGGWIASQDWSTAAGVNLSSEICPRDCEGESCPVGFVPGCYGLRFSVIIDAAIILVTAAIASFAMKPGISKSMRSYGPVQSSQTERPCRLCATWLQFYREIRSAPTAYRTVLVAMILSWIGWFTAIIYRSHFVAVEVLPNPLNDAKVYERNLQIAARGMFYGSILSASTSVVLFATGVRFPQALNPRLWVIWGLSLLGLAGILLLSIFFAVGTFPGTTAGVQVWLAMAGPLGALSMSIPFALTGRISQQVADSRTAAKPGTYMGALNVAMCFPQILVSLLGGPLNSTLHSDAVSFTIGGVGALAAAALVLRRRYWCDRYGPA
ncbi:hypothetical protein FOZ60_010961 [Perkinsus olseni]|uniref:Sucrose transport protein n=3 Tax=Perkinsus olseni TaxID=32597 RepID=A0A7J6NED5_PEROL|nr:hypothetical protein FOZ60_010961 [Perkinsus olseni]